MDKNENKMLMSIDWLEEYELALKDTVSCDTVNCLISAKYYTSTNCCEDVLLFCESCIHALVKKALSMIRHNKAIICSSCKESVNPAGWINKPSNLSLLDNPNTF